MEENAFPFVDYTELYSAIMFWAHDSTPMSFAISTRNFRDDTQLRKIIEHCGGRVERSLKHVTPYTAVLVDDDSLVWSHNGDVFKLSYIKACCTARRCLNISPFRLNKTSTIVKEGFDYMKIIYFKKFSWHTIPRKYAAKVQTNNTDSDDDTHEDGVNSDDNFLNTDDSDHNGTNGNEEGKKRAKKGKIEHNKHTRVSYSRVEKEAILKYIINRDEYDRVRGRQMWQEMERRRTCPNRTWQSMKEHFLKTLVLQLDCFDFVTAEQRRRLLSFM